MTPGRLRADVLGLPVYIERAGNIRNNARECLLGEGSAEKNSRIDKHDGPSRSRRVRAAFAPVNDSVTT